MIDEEIKKLIDEQNSKLQQVFTRSDLQSALSALEKLDLDDLLIIDIGSENPIFGKIVLSKEFGVIVDSGAGRYYYLIPKEAIRSIQFAPKNGELQQLLGKQKERELEARVNSGSAKRKSGDNSGIMPGSFDASLRSRIDEINATINGWRPLPTNPVEFVDPKPFTGINTSSAFPVKTGDQIKIRIHNKGNLNIKYDLIGTGDRTGIGRDFLVTLYRRLSAFKKLLDDEATMK